MMTRPLKNTYQNVSTTKKLVVVSGIFLALFGGIFSAVVAASACKNYIHPYAFLMTSGAIGLIVGFLFVKLIKPYVILNRTMQSTSSRLAIPFSTGFIGGFMLLAHTVNTGISSQECDEFTVIDMEHIPARHKIPEYDILYINLHGKTESLHCKHRYWKHTAIGEKVGVCIYKSPIGFDNLVLKDED